MNNKKQITEHFTLDELTYSRTAVENGLENVPGPEAARNLNTLAIFLLQPLRNRLGAPIAVTSGYRNEVVNLLAGGVPDSQHTKGEAADLYCAQGASQLLQTLLGSGLNFDQVILYRKRNFLHVSYREGFNRKQVVYK